MQLTDDQQRAVDLAINGNKQIILIEGCAGTGKTQILAEIAKRKGCPVLTPTNKAAQVLRDRGVMTAQTLHSFLYSPSERTEYEEDADGNIIYVQNEDGEKVPVVKSLGVGFSLRGTDEMMPLCCIDEGSMIGEQELDDCLEVFHRVVMFRDPFQLPPVRKEVALDGVRPDIFLDEVHRSAWDNPITRFATQIRRGEKLDWSGITKMRSGSLELIQAIVNEGYQAICWTNGLRHALNDECREYLDLPSPPVAGERVVCRENLYESDEMGSSRLSLYNGQILTVSEDVKDTKHHFEPSLIRFREKPDRTFRTWPFWKQKFRNASQAKIKNYILSKSRIWQKGRNFDFSYALTAHTAQGSEWPNVIVYDQRRIMRTDADRWFYTAVTRAKEKLIIAD